jgi:hypothetical protein
MTARYLLRFDDIAATMNWPVWDEIEAMLCAEGLAPILAGVPDNQDEAVKIALPNEMFLGTGAGMAGPGLDDRDARVSASCHHARRRYPRREPGERLRRPPASRTSDPSPPGHRRDRLDRAVAFVRRRHLRLVRALGFTPVSDGLFALPHVDDVGLTWVPRALWGFRWLPFVVWTNLPSSESVERRGSPRVPGAHPTLSIPDLHLPDHRGAVSRPIERRPRCDGRPGVPLHRRHVIPGTEMTRARHGAWPP